MSSVALYCEGNEKYGFGHIRRSLSLFHYLKEQDISCTIRTISLTGKYYLPIQENNDEKNIKLVVLDLPFDASEEVTKHKELGRKVICLDCISNVAPDFSLFIFLHANQSIMGAHDIGYKNVIIRKEFFSLILKKPAKALNVLVCLGGADINNQSREVCEILLKKGFHVKLIIGPLARELPMLKHDNLDVYRSPKNFHELMNQANWCVVNGGGILFESLFLEKLTFVIPQTEAEEAIASDLFEKQYIVNFGLKKLYNFAFEDKLNINQRSKLIDGLGLKHISRKISELIDE
ncbi:MAG: spore coat polysaccharide biosynthesis predicted glycosyltransferase SpsG [Alteromonadaceae bacterium]|jgi:spore coat polysaccharide biosynthesis predicted glycosyltransferase SpsG